MVRAKAESVGSGGGSYTTAEFWRDLLLLCTNAIVFYPKHSPESMAAVHLRDRVTKEISASIRLPSTPPTEPTPPPPPDLALTASLLEKPTSAAPLAACRKRSSISNTTKEVKEEKEKPKQEPEGESGNEEKVLEKKINKERSALSRKTRGLRTNKSRGGHAGEGAAAKRPAVAAAPNLKPKAVEETAVVEAAATADKKSGSAATPSASMEKQKRVASSPNRMKRSSKGTTTETLRSSSSRGGGGGGGKAAEQKKRRKGEGGKDQRTRQGTGGVRGGAATKKVADGSGVGKRSVGRPPKRAASPATPPRPGKRAKGDAQVRAPPKSPPPGSRKRGRR